MTAKDKPTRVVGDLRSLDYATTSSFFEGRGRRADANHLTATMYQSEDLATGRDLAEKARILPLMHFRHDDRVLDIGCGTGRWAEAVAPGVDAYLGIDFSEALLETARMRAPAATFQAMNVAHLDAEGLTVSPPFTAIICSGILIYINDVDVCTLFRALSAVAAPESRIYLREPMATTDRLTLDRHWSDELQDHYSAIYRTREQYGEFFAELAGFEICAEGNPFPDELQNRSDTTQRYVMLKRAAGP